MVKPVNAGYRHKLTNPDSFKTFSEKKSRLSQARSYQVTQPPKKFAFEPCLQICVINMKVQDCMNVSHIKVYFAIVKYLYNVSEKFLKMEKFAFDGLQ